jgi:hypothetical protein
LLVAPVGSPSLEDVFHEDAIQAGGKTLAPDYAFCVSGGHRFFLEVKKPAVSLKGDVGHALCPVSA